MLLTEREMIEGVIATMVILAAVAIIIYWKVTTIEPEGRHHKGREKEWESRDGSGQGATNSPVSPANAAATPAGTPGKTNTGPARRPWVVTVPPRPCQAARIVIPAPVTMTTRAVSDPHARVNPSRERLATTGELRALAYAGDLDTIRSEVAAYRAVAQLEEWVYD